MTTPSAPREETLGTYEMLWDCGHCDTKKNLGVTHRHCPNCGAPQDASKRYFPPDAERVAVADHAYTGADRVCASCQTAQSAKANNCGRCGAPLAGMMQVPFVVEKGPAKRKRRPWGWIIGAIVLLLGIVIWWRCRKADIDLTVTGHRWTTVIDIEEYRDVTESGWRRELPSDARAVSCRLKGDPSKREPDGEDCKQVKRDKGDGTFEEVRQCTPRYKNGQSDWCDYHVDRWVKVEEQKLEGRGLEVSWPTPPPPAPLTAPGARRAGERRGTYVLELTDGKRTRTCAVSEGTWRKRTDGQKIKAQIRAASGELVCSSL